MLTATPRDQLCINLNEMAEAVGFEPTRGVTRLSVFKTDPFSQTWVCLRILMVAAEGIEPPTSRV